MVTVGTVLIAHTGSYVHSKLRIWRQELDQAALKGDEQLLDLGCGHGAVLIEAARRLPTGHVVGVDLWGRLVNSPQGPSCPLSQR
ncbi:Methyltransferase domain-containing protein [Streptomyces sp. Ag109_G2-15]|nr:Methyltransferase domain-containing protein [Streptomyces sp. Ag109_G2-15]